MGGEKVMQEILSGLNIYNPSQGVHYGHVVAEQQVAIHFSSYKDMTDHTKAEGRAGYFPLLSNEHCMPDFNCREKKKRTGFCLKNYQVLLYSELTNLL